MKFKLDENLPLEATALLREAGFDAKSVLDQNLGGEADGRLAEVCREEQRVFLTFDADFANIRSYPPSQHAGLVVFRLQTQAKTHLLEILEGLVAILKETSPVGCLWIVEEGRIRIRE